MATVPKDFRIKMGGLYVTSEDANITFKPLAGTGSSFILADSNGVLSRASGGSGSVIFTLGSTAINLGDIVTDIAGVTINGTTVPSSKTLLITEDIGVTVQAWDADLDAIAALTGTSGFLKTNGSGTWSVDTNTYLTTAVTSVGLSLPGIFTVTNSPVTTTGTLTATLASQTAKTFFAAPNGSDGTPVFRSIVASDLPDLSGTYQPLDGDLTSIAAITGTGWLQRTGVNTWSLGTPTDTNYYPTSASYAGGTTAGPVATLAMSGTADIVFPAIPSASVTASGIITTGSQEFAGTKTLTSPVIKTSLTTTSTSFDLVNTTATTINFAGAATSLSIGASTGTTTINNSVVVDGNLTVNGTTTTINSTVVSIDDIVFELGAVATPTDTTAEGGGISLLGTTNKTILWSGTGNNWTSSENFNLASGKVYKIDNVEVLSSTKVLGITPTINTVGFTLAGGSSNTVAVTFAGGAEYTFSGTNGATYTFPSVSATLAPIESPAFTGTVTFNAAAGIVTAAGTTTGTATMTLPEVFDSAVYDGAEFTVKVTNGSDLEIVRVLVVTDGSTFWVTQYGDVQSNGDLASIDFAITGGLVDMTITPVPGTTGTTSAKVVGHILAV